MTKTSIYRSVQCCDKHALKESKNKETPKTDNTCCTAEGHRGRQINWGNTCKGRGVGGKTSLLTPQTQLD